MYTVSHKNVPLYFILDNNSHVLKVCKIYS